MELDRLFRVCQQVDLPGKQVTVRALGDAENRFRFELALAEANKLRRKLKDRKSLEYLNLIEALEDATDLELQRTLTLGYEQLEAVPEAWESIKPRFIPEPENPTTEEKLAAREEQEVEDKSAERQRTELVQNLTDSYRQNVETWPREKLVKEAQAQAFRLYPQAKYLEELRYTAVYLSTEDKDGRVFPDLETVHSLSNQVLDRLYAAFQSVNEVSVWELDKAVLRGN